MHVITHSKLQHLSMLITCKLVLNVSFVLQQEQKFKDNGAADEPPQGTNFSSDVILFQILKQPERLGITKED